MTDKPLDSLEHLCEKYLESENSFADVEWVGGLKVATTFFNAKENLHIKVIIQREPFDDETNKEDSADD